MNDKIRAHIDALFKDAPSTQRVSDAREELLAGCLDKYADLTASGCPPEEAYIAVISGIGDVDELLRAIGQLDETDPKKIAVNRQKRALFISAGIFLYILSVVAAVFIDSVIVTGNSAYRGEPAPLVFLLLAGVATAVLLYGILSTRVNVKQPGVSMSGEILEQLTGDHRNNKLLSAISSSLWSMLTMIYLCVGFFADLWHPGWLIFLFGAVLQVLIKMLFSKSKNLRAQISGLIWTLTTFIYLVLSFLTDRWELTWLIFLLALCAQQIWNLLRVWRESNEK